MLSQIGEMAKNIGAFIPHRKHKARNLPGKVLCPRKQPFEDVTIALLRFCLFDPEASWGKVGKIEDSMLSDFQASCKSFDTIPETRERFPSNPFTSCLSLKSSAGKRSKKSLPFFSDYLGNK